MVKQFFGRLCDQLRPLARPAFEKQQALAEYEAVKQERLSVRLLSRQTGCAVEMPDVLSRAASTLTTAAAAASSDRAHCRIASSTAMPSVFMRSE
jgi:hypothetical protein